MSVVVDRRWRRGRKFGRTVAVIVAPATFLYHRALLLGLAVVVFRRQK